MELNETAVFMLYNAGYDVKKYIRWCNIHPNGPKMLTVFTKFYEVYHDGGPMLVCEECYKNGKR